MISVSLCAYGSDVYMGILGLIRVITYRDQASKSLLQEHTFYQSYELDAKFDHQFRIQLTYVSKSSRTIPQSLERYKTLRNVPMCPATLLLYNTPSLCVLVLLLA